MLKRGSDPEAKIRRRFGAEDPFSAHPTATVGPPPVLGGWSAMASYFDLEPALVAEMARAAMSSGRVVALRSGEVGVGAMLASLAVRGEDVLLDNLLPLGDAEIRVHRYTVGKLEPIAVHPVDGVAPLLRALALCAASATHESWEAVAHDGRNPPVAIGSAQKRELRWLQPPAPDSPDRPPWMTPTTQDPPPGTSVAAWQDELRRGAAAPIVAAPAAAPSTVAPPRPAAPADARLPDPDAPIGPAVRPGPTPEPAADPAPMATRTVAANAPEAADEVSQRIIDAVTSALDHALSNALVELQLDPTTLAQLRDDRIPEQIAQSVSRLEAQMVQVEVVSRQVQDLTAAVDSLAESARSLMRHQWDNAPPPNFWVKVQRADDEVRRAVDELTSEIRTRLARPVR
ncbi:MAG: hypothetical protein Q8K58_06940 [Acidimicrobiales bacterium]|nr:hypothetical protein [Acidimicrobiales bacterium]